MSNNNFLPPLHPQFSYRVDYIGNEKTPVLIVDNFLHEAEVLLGFAMQYGEFRDGTDFYPGIQSEVPEFYSAALQAYLGNIICATFNIEPTQISHSQSMYSMVLTPPARLAIPQARPHTDTNKKNKFACVHYLCTPEKGGTSLYRHRATGFETLSEARMDEYAEHLEQEVKDSSWLQKYINGSNKYYEEIGRYEANFNRLVMYPGDALHSASIPENFKFFPNPKIGRLTLNSFIHLKAAD
jgi:hypothetical protein